MSSRPPLTTERARRRSFQRARIRRRRRVAGALVAVVVVGTIVAVTTSGSGPSKPHQAGATASAGAHPATAAQAGTVKAPLHAIPAIESGLLPWQLSVPISRAAAIAAAGQVVVLGGLTGPNASTAGVATVAVPGGKVQFLGDLTAPTHDAPAALLHGRYVVFGGGQPATVATVQSFPVSGSGGGTVAGTDIGQLPQPRSDAAAVVVGGRAYLVGGYDGTRADPTVLATSNGQSFKKVATLPVPVRYPAVAALGQTIYAFGGLAVAGHDAGQPVDTVQRIDLATGKAKVIGHLAQPLAGASAIVLGGHLYVVGGATDAAGAPSSTVWAFDARTDHLLEAGSLQVPVAYASLADVAGTGWLIGGEASGTPVSSVQMLRPNLAFGWAGAKGAGSPYFGARLLVADRGNDRLLLLSDTNKVVWTYPSATAPAPPGPKGFFFPDDSFFVRKGTAIITNQEENETIVEIGFPSGKILWTYGHPAKIGSAPGYLHEPDDAYLLKDGQISVADADNCRVLIINPNGTIAHQIGTTGVCVHQPPNYMTSPNADTPLANGNILISEIKGSWIDEYTPTGQLVWSTHVNVPYPSDPQQLGPNLYLMTNYSTPGGIIEFNRSGQILYQYQPASGPGMLNQPSLAEKLPSGVFMVNDDYRDRMVAIDPTTQALVWQYGVTDHPGTAPGMLNTPDGFDLLLPNGTTPTHPATG